MSDRSRTLWVGFRGNPAALIASTLLLAACDSLLEVDPGSRVIDAELNQPIHAALLTGSAVIDFECAFGGYIVAAGLHGDELQDAQLTASYWNVDRRTTGEEGGPLATVTCNTANVSPGPGIYTAVSTARFLGDDVAGKLQGWSDAQVANRQQLLATAFAYAGYSVLLLGESYCSLALDIGPEQTRIQAFEAAEQRFTSAIAAAQAASSSDILNLARVGRARARLNLAVVGGNVANATKLTEAGADAQQVPQGFVKNATYANTVARRYNTVFASNVFFEWVTVEDDFRNLTTQGVPDPRVAVTNQARVATGDRITPLWTQQKYAALGSSIPIARWAEAQLILAESQGGASAVNIINGLRTLAGLPSYGGGTAAEIRQEIVRERARELFLESHHLGDKLRYGLPFTPAAGAPYPPKAGGAYGNTTCIPLPIQERQNNPNL